MRIWTNRNFPDFNENINGERLFIKNDSVEWLEFDKDSGIVFWKFNDYTNYIKDMFVRHILNIQGPIDTRNVCDGGSFPVDIDFIKEKFKEAGRSFDKTKLPSNFVENPYL